MEISDIVDTITMDVYDKVLDTGDKLLIYPQDETKVDAIMDYIELKTMEIVGVESDYMLWIENKSKALTYLDKYLKGDASAKTMYDIYNDIANGIKFDESKNDLKYASISKYMGFKIDPKQTKVIEFLGYVGLMKEEFKRNSK